VVLLLLLKALLVLRVERVRRHWWGREPRCMRVLVLDSVPLPRLLLVLVVLRHLGIPALRHAAVLRDRFGLMG
jgi:hypothetical protein